MRYSLVDTEKRLMIIDDETSLLLFLQEYLEQYGLKVFTYEEIPDLENELKKKKPHAILLDIIMPHVSGIDILKEIKKIDQRIPVIMMTGYADETKRIESLRSGAYALLTKPFQSLEELYHTANNAMDHYLESLRTEELNREVEERYKREKMNILELDFLKNLQHMIGETEDPAFVLENASTLLKNFLNFKYFAALLLQDDEANIQVYPNLKENRELLEFIASTLLKTVPHSKRDQLHKVVLQGNIEEAALFDKGNEQAAIVALSTVDKIYGYAGLFREAPFDNEEELIFSRFCAHITHTLEKIRLFNEIKMLSIHDGLTGVFNHAYIIGALESEAERAKRYNAIFSIILLDIDNFKAVNDSCGHLAGDAVLRNLAQLIVKSLRAIDIVGRYGGEEFLVILPETDLEKASVVGEKLRKTIEAENFSYNDNAIQLTISLGITSYHDRKSIQDFIKAVDDNLYRAKADGKNRICYER